MKLTRAVVKRHDYARSLCSRLLSFVTKETLPCVRSLPKHRLHAYCEFLAIKVAFNDTKATNECLLPSDSIYSVWKTHMTTPQSYADMCASVLDSVVVEHDPAVWDSVDAKKKQMATYRLRNSIMTAPVSEEWMDGAPRMNVPAMKAAGILRILVKHPTGLPFDVYVHKKSRATELYRQVAQSSLIPMHGMNLIYKERILPKSVSLEQYGMENGDEVTVGQTHEWLTRSRPVVP